MRMRFMFIRMMQTMTLRLILTALAMSSLLLIQFAPINLTQAQDASKMASLSITTTPASYPILIDDKPAGEMNSNKAVETSLLLRPGKHTIKILFPNNNQWVKEIKFTKSHAVCMELDYISKDTDSSDPKPAPSPNPFHTKKREDFVDITYPNGDKLIGNTDLCRDARIPRRPWYKRIFKRNE